MIWAEYDLPAAEVKYSVHYRAMSEWRVGYSPRNDIVFVYFVDGDEILWGFSGIGLQVLPLECVVWGEFIDLGEL